MKVLYIGSCSSEYVALNLPNVEHVAKVYRVPTACLSDVPFDGSDLYKWEYEELSKRVKYEANRTYMRALTETEYDLILIDFWRDAYVDLLEIDGQLLSLAWEIAGRQDILDDVTAKYPTYLNGSEDWERAFWTGLSFLTETLAKFQSKADLVFLDCLPVTKTVQDGLIVPLSHKDKDYWEMYHQYRLALERYKMRLQPAAVILMGAGAHSAPDAPWGESPLHYAHSFYNDAAKHLSNHLGLEAASPPLLV